MLSHLVASFATLPDPRCAGRTRHRLLNLLVIAVCAVVAGAETWVDIAPYGQMKHAWLTTFLDLPHGIPSHDTFRRVFSLVDPQGLELCFRQWMATTAPPLPREVVAVDGKTIRRSFDRGRAHGPLHVVSAFATQQGLSLGQVAVAGKGQELTAIPILLKSLHLVDTIVTLDALGCQQVIARQLLAQQADYILALKGNQGRCHRAVVAYCQATCFDRWATRPADYDAFDRRHGRWVRRRAWVLPLCAELSNWPQLNGLSLGMRKRFVTLDSDERATLQAGRHHHPQHQFRARCQGLLLSADGHPVSVLMQVLDVRRSTVYAWFTRWETGGLAGLTNAAGQGRPPVLTAADEPQVHAAVRANRQQLKEVKATLRQELNKDFSPRTLKRFLKSVVGVGAGSATA